MGEGIRNREFGTQAVDEGAELLEGHPGLPELSQVPQLDELAPSDLIGVAWRAAHDRRVGPAPDLVAVEPPLRW